MSTKTREDDAHQSTSAGIRDWAGLVVLSFAVLLIAVDATVLDLALPKIGESLEPSSIQLLWIIDVYSFVLAGLLLTMGTLGDRFGRRRLLLAGALGFGVASVLAAWATTPQLLIVARTLQGIAGATLMPATLGLIRSMFTNPRQRTTAIGIWSAMAGGGAAVGPLIGGWLLEHCWWGSVFLINVPVMTLLIALGPVVIPESCNPTPGSFDIPSAALSMLSVVPLVYAVKETAAHGLSLQSTGMVILAVAAGIAFLRRQRRHDQPMLDLRLFANRAFTIAVLTDFFAVFALVGVLFFGAQYLQAVLDYSPFEAGMLLLPGAAGSIVASAIAPLLARGWHAGTLLSVGFAISALGAALLGWLRPHGDATLFVIGLVLVCIGVGLALTLTSDLVVSTVNPESAGAAAAVSETTYELGAALGVAIVGCVVMKVFRHGLDQSLLTDNTSRAAVETISGAVAVAHELPESIAQEFLISATTSFVDGIRVAAVITAALFVVASMVSHRLRRHCQVHQSRTDFD